jgi:hypothetical protein
MRERERERDRERERERERERVFRKIQNKFQFIPQFPLSLSLWQDILKTTNCFKVSTKKKRRKKRVNFVVWQFAPAAFAPNCKIFHGRNLHLHVVS